MDFYLFDLLQRPRRWVGTWGSTSR